jgi:hypothetical protein
MAPSFIPAVLSLETLALNIIAAIARSVRNKNNDDDDDDDDFNYYKAAFLMQPHRK